MELESWNEKKIGECFFWERKIKHCITKIRAAFIINIGDKYKSTIFLHDESNISMLRCYSSPYTSELKTFVIEDADLDVAKLKTDLYLVDNGYTLDLVEPKGEVK